MVTGSGSKDYWVLRLTQAVEKALEAPTERSRAAHLELARHYRSMHVLINGEDGLADLAHGHLESLGGEGPESGGRTTIAARRLIIQNG